MPHNKRKTDNCRHRSTATRKWQPNIDKRFGNWKMLQSAIGNTFKLWSALLGSKGR